MNRSTRNSEISEVTAFPLLKREQKVRNYSISEKLETDFLQIESKK